MFCPAAIQPNTSVYNAFLHRPCSYTANATKQRTRLYRCFFCRLPHSPAANTRPTQAAIISPVQCWSVSQRRSASSAYQDTTTAPGRCTAQHSRPIIIRYIMGQRCALCYGSMPDGAAYRRPCQPGGLRSGTGLTIRAGTGWHTPPGGAVQRNGHGGRRGTIDGYRRISFRAFAR